MSLPEPDIEGQSEPHPIDLMSDHIFSSIGSDPDTMHLEEALSQPARVEFNKAMEKEFKDHINLGHRKVISVKHVTKDKIPLPMVW